MYMDAAFNYEKDQPRMAGEGAFVSVYACVCSTTFIEKCLTTVYNHVVFQVDHSLQTI